MLALKNPHSLTPELLARCKKNYEADPSARLLTATVSGQALGQAAQDPGKAALMDHNFSIELKTRGITAQQQSGRCWLFASMNVMREIVAEKCNMEKVELSGNFLAFWDKLEKINYTLEAAIDCADLPIHDRTLDWILKGMNDGGQWDMMVSVVKKYGIVPAYVMPETEHSKSTRGITQIVNMKLHKDIAELRRLIAEGKDPAGRKEEMILEYYKALCIVFGKPVEQFDYEYTDKDGVYHVDRGLTPKSFFDKYIGLELGDYVNVINGPTADKPFGRTFTVKYLGNVVEGHIKYLNLPIQELKELCVKQMQAGEVVWFGSDCGKFGDRDAGFWDPDSFLYGDILGGFSLEMSKADRLDYSDSAMNHAMVLCGVNLDDSGKPDRWKIENSWGDAPGKKGYFVASDAWFEQFVYQVVINKKFLTDDQRKALESDPIELAPWDPMGSLA